MVDHNGILIEELEKRLIWYREEASEEEFDPEAVDAICTMLQKLSPAKEPHRTKEEAYENIMRLIRLEEEELGECGGADGKELDKSGVVDESKSEKSGGMYGKRPDKNGEVAGKSFGGVDESEPGEKKSDRDVGGRKRIFLWGERKLRAAVIFIAVVGVLASLNMVTYAREDKSLFTMILERVGVLKIEKDETVDESLVGVGKTSGEFYDSWADLDIEVKERVAVPKYIPEGYSLYGIRYWDLNNRKLIQSDYYDRGNRHILLVITLWEDNEDHYKETLMDEDENRLISESSDKNTLYYQYEDEYLCLAFRKNGFYRISGNIVIDEMIKMGEGLGDIR